MNYLKFILRHKWFVFLECLKLSVPILTAILHDWDKFRSDEWFAYKRRFDNGNDFTLVADDPEYNMAYHLHCNRRNKHHWQWWISQRDNGKTRVLKMSDMAMREMMADWRGMARTLNKPNIWEWYEFYRPQMTVHPENLVWLDEQIEEYRLVHVSKTHRVYTVTKKE